MTPNVDPCGPRVSLGPGRYKDVGAVVLESEALRVTIVPERGAKIPSLIHKKTGQERLFQLPGQEFRKAVYGAPYETGEVAGFDEMFPWWLLRITVDLADHPRRVEADGTIR